MLSLTNLTFGLISVLFTPLSLSAQAAQATAQSEPILLERPPMALVQGEQRLLTISGIKKYSVGNDTVHVLSWLSPSPSAGFRLPKNSILIKAQKIGATDLWIWKQDGSSEHRMIRVEKWLKQDETAAGHLQHALDKLEEVEIVMSGPLVVLRGELRSLSEAARIGALIQAYQKSIRDETEPSHELLEIGQTRLQKTLKSTSSSKLRLGQQGSTLIVSGSVALAANRASIEKQLRTAYPLVQLDLDSLPDDNPTVYFRVFLLELKKTSFGSLGLTWPANQMGAFHVSSWGVREALQLDLTLQALESDGSAKILSNPELVVRAPGEAELFAGGEIPIRQTSHLSSNVSWKPYGLTLKLNVTHVSGDRVRLDISTEVSHLDTAISNEDIPGIQSNRMKTQVDAQFGTPLLLSGLLQHGIREQARGLPFLRRIPVLGSLFGSDDYMSDRSELVAILLPAAAPPSSPMKRIERLTPRGFFPPPRHWIAPEDEENLRNSPNFPWNALQ